MKAKKSNLQPPKYIWADCDPEAPRSVRLAFYNTLDDQRGNRPDLKPIKLRIVPNDALCHPAGSGRGAQGNEPKNL